MVATLTVPGEPDITTSTGPSGRPLAVAAEHLERLVLVPMRTGVRGCRRCPGAGQCAHTPANRAPGHLAPATAPDPHGLTGRRPAGNPAVLANPYSMTSSRGWAYWGKPIPGAMAGATHPARRRLVRSE
jgi:hypothetical protein